MQEILDGTLRVSKPFIVVSDGMDENAFSSLRGEREFNVYHKNKLNAEQLEEFLPKMSAIVIRSKTKITSDLLDKAPRLKYIIRAGEGTDNIDKVSCKTKGVCVSNTPGANSQSAAEHAIALIMTLLRHTANAHKSMVCGKWDKSLFTGGELTGKHLGIVGFGRVGQLVAHKLRGFEPEILFFDPYIQESDLPRTSHALSLEDIFINSDIVTLHLPLNEKTAGIINAQLISSMKTTGLLINTSRGEVLDEEALYKALLKEDIAGAGLDVFSQEPLPESSPLRKLKNVVLTPHLGASTVEAQQRVAAMVLHQLKEFFLNGNPINKVGI